MAEGTQIRGNILLSLTEQQPIVETLRDAQN